MSIQSYHCPSQRGALDDFTAHRESAQVSWYVLSKTTLDFLAAAVLLALSWPLILTLMALVRLTSRGPALYKQVRLGLDGQPYSILKLRTMFHECESETGPQWAKARDPRATPLGRMLRATHLDELPQLWNVVRGEMSLIGPRPERPEFVRELERVIPNYRERLRVRPGITGLAQVQLPPDEDIDGVARKVAYDVYYVERTNLWLDLRILIGTALKMLGNSYSCIRLLVALPRPEVVLGKTPEEGLDSEMSLPEFVTTAG
jgi:lipopolysaccharide/colanic/teichoic acid biosynthesis glycosyltransferase